jgi:hypothetical protein
LRDKGLEWIKLFSPERTVQDLREMYRHVLAK